MNYLLNELVDLLEKEARKAKGDPENSSPSENIANGPRNGLPNGVQKEPLVTWVHKNFQVTSLGLFFYSLHLQFVVVDLLFTLLKQQM